MLPLLVLATSSSAGPLLTWVSGTVLPNQTVLASGSGLGGSGCLMELNTSSPPTQILVWWTL